MSGSRMKIIAFGHRKRVGKDTAAKFLMSNLRLRWPGISIRKAGFADKMKEVAHQLYGHYGLMSADWYEEPMNERFRFMKLPLINLSPIEIWIALGNGVRERVHNQTWLNYLLYSAQDVNVLIVKDMRFPVEANKILEVGGQIYRIDRPGSPIDADGADDQLVNYDGWTDIIINDGDLNAFYAKIAKIADGLII